MLKLVRRFIQSVTPAKPVRKRSSYNELRGSKIGARRFNRNSS